MKKRILSIFLVLIMLIQMLPTGVLAADSSSVIDITDVAVKGYGQTAMTIQSVTIDGAAVISYNETDTNTLEVVLAADTDPSQAISVTFSVVRAPGIVGSSQSPMSIQLANGENTTNFTLTASAMQGNRPGPVASGTYTIKFTTQKLGTAYAVTGLEGDGYTVNGETKAYEGNPYAFSVAVEDGYNKSNMTVSYKCGDTTTVLNPDAQGNYKIESVTGDIEIIVNGIEKKELWTVTLSEGKGYTLSSTDTPYKGEEYTFTVSVDNANYKIDDGGLRVLVNGEETAVQNSDGSYSINPLDGDKTVSVTGIVERTLYTVTAPNAEGVTFSGEATVREGKEYSFTLTVDNAYNASAMVVKNHGEKITLENGKYTISKVDKAPLITVEGVVPKEKHVIELVGGEGYTITGDSYAYDGEAYSFTVTLNKGYMADPETGLLAKLNDGETVNLVSGQKYTVESVTENLRISVTGVVESGVEPTVILSGGRKPHKTWGYVDTITVDQVQVEDYKWVGDEAYIALSAKTSDTATAKVSFKTGGNRMGAMPDTEIPLTDGKADKSFTAKTTAFNYTWNFTLHFSNEGFAPTFVGDSAEKEAEAYVGSAYTLDLKPLFADVFDQALSYSVQVGEGTWEAVEGSVYSIVPEKEGALTLKFRASNAQQTSVDVYTLKLNVFDASATYAVTVNVPQGIDPVFYASNAAGELIAELQSTVSQNIWTVNVPENTTYLAWRTDGWGGMAFAAEENGTISLRQLKLNVVDYDYKAAESTNTVTYDGHTAVSGENGWLLVAGKTYTVQAVPKDTAALDAVTEDVALQVGEGIYEHQLMLGIKNPVTITVPTGATAQLYKWDKYYSNTELDAKIVKDNSDGTTSYYFIANTEVSGTAFIYRIAMEGKITKAGWLKWGQKSLNISYSDADKSPAYRLDDYSGTGEEISSFTEDSVLLNVNSRNHLNLSAGQSKTLKAYRAWEIIPTSYNNYIVTPDFHYKVLSDEDVVSLSEKDSPSAGEGDWMTLTAEKEGTAVIEVTYDAIDVRSEDTRAYPYQGVYGASDPARSGLVVVQVGEANDASVNFGIDCFTSVGISTGSGSSGTIAYNPNAKRAWDAEFDTLYFTGSSGEMKLQPTASSAITEVAVSHDKGENWTVLTGTDGVYTAKIVSGNNILRVKTAAGTAYQVVRGDKVTYSVTEVNEKSNGDGALEVGETVRITLNGLHMPIPKMAGNYNPGGNDSYGGNKYTKPNLSYDINGERVHGTGTGQYSFINTNNSIEVTIPESGVVELCDGYIGLGEIGLDLTKGDSHRNIPDAGCMTRGSNTYIYTQCILPDITITAEGVDTTVPVSKVTISEPTKTVNVGESFTLTAKIEPENATVQSATWKSSEESVVTVNENGKVTAVGVGEATVTASAGEKTAECKITVKEIPVERISLDFTAAELKIGEKITLTATVEPENATDQVITWKSSDESVAKVSSGIVSAVGEGEATVTAEADGKTAVCVITVKKPQETTEDTANAKVYFSVSHEDAFVKTGNNVVAALQEIEVPYFDLSAYGLGDFTLPETHEAYGKPTALHLYIYATEVLWCGVSEENAGKGYLYNQNLMGTDLLNLSGTPGSLTTDMFWNMDMNMNYYHNYLYPTENGNGTTADRIVLNNGDIITIGHFESYDFHQDSSSAFNYLTADGSSVTASVLQGKNPVLNVYRAGKDFGHGTNTPVNEKIKVYYVNADSLTTGDVTKWDELGTTNTKGKLTADISELEPGKYILAVAGRKGAEYTNVVTSAPGGIVLTILEDADSQKVQEVIDQIDDLKPVDQITLDDEAEINAAWEQYQSLSDDQQNAVANFEVLKAAKEKLRELKKAKADQAAADAFAAKVNAIDLDAENCKAAIDDAKAAYENLTPDQKELAKTAKAKLDQIEKEYAEQIASEEDRAAADAVESKIASIGKVGLGSEAKIKAALQAYEKLTAEQKLLVNNLDVLTAAEAELVEAKIKDIGTVKLESEAKIKAARAAFEALSKEQKDMVENLGVLEEAEETLGLLKLAGTDITNIYKATGDYLEGLSAPGIGTQNGEWRVLGLARAGKSVSDSYYNAVVRYVMDNIDENSRLYADKSTENARLIIALTALGKDVTDIGGYDLLAGLDDMEYIGKQGVNGTIWTLIAFDTHDYDIPTGDVTREKLVSAILKKQNADGGWSLGGSTSDPDMTGMALQALAPYYGTDTKVKSAVDEALSWLSGIQEKDGTFTSSEGTTSESVSQVITALTALGINPETDSRFVKNGVSAVDALSKFYVEGGGFKHGLTGERNVMATEQGYFALVSYFRLLQEKTSLYDMSDVTVVVPVYKIISGANGEWQKDDASFVIVSDGEFTKFTGVKMDGATVDSKHYTAKAGSTVVIFSTDYLNTLSEGDHAVTLTFTNGEASTMLTVLPSDEEAAKRVIELIDQIGTVTESSGEKIKAAKEAYNKLTDEQKKLVTNYSKLTEAESRYEEIAATVSVSFTLLGCYEHGSDETHTLSAGNLNTWIAKTTYRVEPGTTVKGVLEKALAAAGMSWSNPTGNYVESINGIGEFTNGSLSGWMYTINGVHSGLGVAEQAVKDGDAIVFHYTDDYTKESGSTQYGDKQAAKYVEGLINALDKTDTSFESDVLAAKKAYDALTPEQKKLVTNYSKLTDALKSLADEKDVKAAEEVEKLIDAIGAVTKDSEEEIKAAREAYDKLTAAQKALVENILLLEMAEERFEKLLEVGAAEDIYKQTGDYLETLGTPGIGSIGGEWMVIGLIRSGREIEDVDAYYNAVLQFVEENIDENGRLHKAKSSENARLILALTALGKDATNVGGHDLLKGLGDMQYVKTQGINGPIWTLIALDSGNYPVPEGDVSRDALLMTILNAQLSDGGWALSGAVSDPDMTGMALQALAPYYEENADVKAAVDRALQALSDMQTADGAFASIDGKCAESAAQVLAALSALGIDANTDARFIKNGVSVLDALCAFFVKDGGFRHVPDGTLDGMATEQAYYALTAYFRMLNGKCSLFDMTDIIDMGGDVEAEEPKAETEEKTEAEKVPAVTEPVEAPEKADFPWWILIIAVIVIAAGSVLVVLIPVMKKKNK